MKRIWVAGIMIMLACLSPIFAQSSKQTAYPKQNINMIIPYGAGGGTDNAARAIAQFMEQELGVRILPINKAGAGGEVGVIEYLNSPSDGYTIACFSFPDFMISDIVNKDFDFDFYKSVEYLGAFTSTPLSYYAMKSAPYSNLQEFVAYCKANPKRVTVAEAGIAHRVMAAGIMDYFKIDYTLVNFNSANESISALLGGHVNVIGNTNANLQKITSSGGKVIAWGGSTKPAGFPDLPMFTDYGMSVDYLSVAPVIVVKKDVPQEVKDRLLAVLVKLASNPELRKKLESLGYQWQPRNGAELTKYFFDNFAYTKTISEKYSKVILGD